MLPALGVFAEDSVMHPDPGHPAILVQEFIYPSEDRPTPQCHATTLVETHSGIVASWFGGTHEKNDDVGIWVSRLVDGGWTYPVEVVNGVQSMDLRYPTWNPVLFQPRTGPLTLYYKVGPDPRTWWGMVTTSEDGGKTWSWPVKLGDDPVIGHLLGPIKNKPVQLNDGTILSPSSAEYVGPGGERIWQVHFEVSRDNGKSWEVIGPINDGIAFDAIQPSILRYPNGDLQVLCRTDQGVVSSSWSRDGGTTWETMTSTGLPNPNSGTDAVSLADGRQLLVYNHTVRGNEFPTRRNMLNVAISHDGIDWTPVLALERQEGEYSYPSVIQSADGRVHITYTYNRELVKYVVLNPAKI
jgi:predicted neuraminidase